MTHPGLAEDVKKDCCLPKNINGMDDPMRKQPFVIAKSDKPSTEDGLRRLKKDGEKSLADTPANKDGGEKNGN